MHSLRTLGRHHKQCFGCQGYIMSCFMKYFQWFLHDLSLACATVRNFWSEMRVGLCLSAPVSESESCVGTDTSPGRPNRENPHFEESKNAKNIDRKIFYFLKLFHFVVDLFISGVGSARGRSEEERHRGSWQKTWKSDRTTHPIFDLFMWVRIWSSPAKTVPREDFVTKTRPLQDRTESDGPKRFRRQKWTFQRK